MFLETQSGLIYFNKVVEHVDPLFQGFLQVLAEGQVLSMVTDLLHTSTLGLLCGFLCPVIVVLTILHITRKHILKCTGYKLH